MNQQMIIIIATILVIIILASTYTQKKEEHFYNELQPVHFYNDRQDHEGYDYVKPSYFGNGFSQCCNECVNRYNVQSHDLRRARFNSSTYRTKLFASESKLKDVTQLKDYYQGLSAGYKRRLSMKPVTVAKGPPYWFTTKQPNSITGLGVDTMNGSKIVI